MAPSPQADDRALLTRLVGTDADRLIAYYGSAAEALSIAPDGLESRFGPLVATRVADIRDACLTLLRREALDDVFGSPEGVVNYVRAKMARLPREEVRLLYLDAAHRLRDDELIAIGTLDEAPIYPREIIRRSLEVGARAIIIAHNHPSGSLRPSNRDIAATKSIAAAGRTVGIELLDHLIVSRSGWTSLRAEGVL